MSTSTENLASDTPQPLARVFGLTELDIQDVVMQGFFARVGCSPHHPRTYPGLTQWAETVRALRDKTIPLGWETRDINNFPLSVHPSKKIVIAIQTGDRETGTRTGNPSNRAAKGTTTEGAVARNEKQLQLFDSDVVPAPPSGDEINNAIMWVLLYHVAPGEIRFELSLPLKMIGGKIRSWQERIVFEPIQIEQTNIKFGDDNDNGPEIDVPVERRE